MLPNAAFRLEDGNLHSAYDTYIVGNLILMQYTGLKDKNGKEIYEGDVIKSIIPKQGIWSEVTIAYGPVFYKSASFRATTGPHSMDWVRLDSLAPTVETEVIGNIYDNPELLGDVNE